MNEGLLDVRTRDNKRHGKLRVDEVVRMLENEKPKPASAFKDFYAKAFDPAKFYGDVALAQDQVAA